MRTQSSTRWLALLPVGALAAAVACRDDTVAPQLTPTDAPQFVLTGPITDDYALGTPVHGAIFTTTPDGGAVNANVQYRQKIEVYLDGGPRNANSQAAGLPDGLYVFQVTDPPGKLLLSKDPARCRVVQVAGGVIAGTVDARSIPGLGATSDNWADSPSERRQCHVEEGPDGTASAAGQHDTNADTDPGGGTTVQMMPFFDTPNNGGVYKAWITPLKSYVAKGGNLNAQTTGVYSSSPRTLIGYQPDPGFKSPSRNFVKTDNFKVVERPPFIRIAKTVDGAPYTGWPVTVFELVDGAWVGAGFRPTVATFAIPLGTDVRLLACEKVLAGSAFFSATVNGVSAPQVTGGTPPVPADDGQGNPLVCVAVPGTNSTTTIDVVFDNRSPDARISIAPLDATNGIGEPHRVTATVQQDDKKAANTGGGDAATGFGPAPNGTTVTFSLTNSGGATATFVGGVNTCATTGGTCYVTINSPTGGTVVIHATTTFSVNGVSLTRATGPGLATVAGDDARKIYSTGSIAWVKIDGATPPRYLAGATFRVRRTHDRFGAAVTAPDFSVTDNVAPDANPADGRFAVVGLPLGRYCVRETAAPSGYLLDPNEQCGALVSTLNLTLAAPNGSANPFVNSLQGRMTGGSGKIDVTLPNGDLVTITSGFTIHCDITLSNNIEINWPGNRWHIDKPIKTALCIDDPNVVPDQPDAPFDTFIGTAEGALNGQAISRISFTFVDGDGSPGGKANDRVSLTIWNSQGAVVLSFTSLPIRGNLQAHEDQPHR